MLTGQLANDLEAVHGWIGYLQFAHVQKHINIAMVLLSSFSSLLAVWIV